MCVPKSKRCPTLVIVRALVPECSIAAKKPLTCACMLIPTSLLGISAARIPPAKTKSINTSPAGGFA